MKKLVVKKSIEISAPVSAVWNIIASPEAWRRWMLVPSYVDGSKTLELGSRILWKDEHGKTYLTGKVTAFDRNKKFALELFDEGWIRKPEPGEVTYALTLKELEDGKTLVTLTFGDLSIDKTARQWYDSYNESRELENIKEMAEQ